MDQSFVTIKYKTADGKQICVEISTAVKELLEQSDRQIRSQRRQDRRYLSNEEYIDGVTDTASIYPQENTVDLLIRMELIAQLDAAMDKLTDIPRHRRILYFYQDFTYRPIAEMEGVSHISVLVSVTRAIQILKSNIES